MDGWSDCVNERRCLWRNAVVFAELVADVVGEGVLAGDTDGVRRREVLPSESRTA